MLTRVAFTVCLVVPVATAQQTLNSSYKVVPKTIVSVTNEYGPITVKPSSNGQVVVQAVSQSQAVTFDHEQHGNHLDLRARSQAQGDNLAEYTVAVPKDSWVVLKSSGGALRAEQVAGDAVLESTTGTVEVTAMNQGHLHVTTLSGTIHLTNIRDSHLDIHSISGDVNMRDVSGSLVEVHTGGGRISYAGDPGRAGEYLLSSHAGDLDVSVPWSADVQIRSSPGKGQTDKESPPTANSFQQKGSAILKPGINSISRFVLQSLRGTVQVKRH